MIPLSEKYDALAYEFNRMYETLEATHRMLTSQKTWTGQTYTYNNIHSAQYIPIINKIANSIESYHHTIELLEIH